MIQMIIAAFTMGLLGSFHCIGMCGPIALSLPLNTIVIGENFQELYFTMPGVLLLMLCLVLCLVLLVKALPFLVINNGSL